MNTPTPRTDAATYPADCLGKTLVTNRDCSRALEAELTAAKERLRSEAMDDYASIKHLQRELATEREKVRVLREALDEAQSCGGLCGAVFLQARAALAATEDAK